MSMFERFTQEARSVVVRAQDEARSLGHSWVGCEHLLLAVLAQPEEPAAAVLLRFGVTAERFRAAVEELIGSGGRLSDADALRTLGIDLDQVRRRVEENFGPGALDVPPRRRRGRLPLPWRREPDCESQPITGHIGFTPRAKQALELALREALALKDRHIGLEHILLGILRVKDNVTVHLLRRMKVAPDAVRAQLLTELGKAA
jgi:ATP-dependent Clp protease ATP-binding subunit ClpA